MNSSSGTNSFWVCLGLALIGGILLMQITLFNHDNEQLIKEFFCVLYYERITIGAILRQILTIVPTGLLLLYNAFMDKRLVARLCNWATVVLLLLGVAMIAKYKCDDWCDPEQSVERLSECVAVRRQTHIIACLIIASALILQIAIPSPVKTAGEDKKKAQ